MINNEVRHLIQAEMTEDEELLWADRPAKRPYPWRGVFRAGFWVIWMVFVCVWIAGVLTTEPDTNLGLRVVFACIGFVFLFFGYTMRRGYLKAFLGPRYEVYGLTNKRAIILSPLWKEHKFINWRGQDHSINSIAGEDMTVIKVIPSEDRSIGTIIFSGWWDKIRFKWHVYPNPDSPIISSNLNGFRNISDVGDVARIIEERFGKTAATSDAQTIANEVQGQSIKEIRMRRVFLWSIFPSMWLLFTFVVGVSGLLFVSFMTFPFFVLSVFRAIREIIRPAHSYGISS